MKKFENRYENKEFQKKPDNLFSTLFSIGRLVLLIAGVVGFAYNMFKANGWLSMGFAELSKSFTTFFIGGAALLAVLYFADKMFSAKTADGKASNKGDIILYAMMIAGAYFIFKFATE